VRNARSYVIERSPDPPTANTWTQVALVTRSRATITGLASGTKYWFRVAALGPAGQSGWSNPATKVAP
jgi:chitodextrinase